MAFAVKLLDRLVTVNACPQLSLEQAREIERVLAPPVKAVEFGVGERLVVMGGEEVVYRHEFTYFNPTVIAVEVDDSLDEDALSERLRAIERLEIHRVDKRLTVDAIAIASRSNDPAKFSAATSSALESTSKAIVLCSLNPTVMEAGLKVAGDHRPLIYAATKDNWIAMADLALKYRCPLVISSPGDLDTLKSLSKVILDRGINELVLDPGTFPGDGLGKTLDNFTMVRLSSVVGGDELLGFPLMGIPAVVWDQVREKELAMVEESYLASMLIARYASLIIIRNLDVCALLPVLVWRSDLYTDPRKPAWVEAGLREVGEVGKMSPVMMTTNFALTYHTVSRDVESSGVGSYLLVIDTGGLAVLPSVAGRRLTAEKVAEAIKSSGVEERVKHRKLIIPGLAASLKGEIEEKTGWEVLVGPVDSSGIPRFLEENWKVPA
jgi:acetyl-CoA decarbonylase/synthase complex subunit gamma